MSRRRFFRQKKNDLQWIVNQYRKWMNKYLNKWVVVYKKKVVAVSKDKEKARELAIKEIGEKYNPLITFVEKKVGKILIYGLAYGLIIAYASGCGGDGDNGGSSPIDPIIDTTPPIIESFIADKNEVETNENIKFNIKGYDNESPIVKIYIDSDKDDGLDYNYRIDVYGDSIDRNFEYAHSKEKDPYIFTAKVENEDGLFSELKTLKIKVKKPYEPPSGGNGGASGGANGGTTGGTEGGTSGTAGGTEGGATGTTGGTEGGATGTTGGTEGGTSGTAGG